MSDNLDLLQKSKASELVCLGTQALLTIIIIRNLKIHWEDFPIKQLSPLCTLTALLAFFVLNVLSVVGRYYENYDYPYQVQNDVNCGYCRLNGNITLQVLATFYAGLRQLPISLFSLKTLRVSICFLNYKNKQLPCILRLIFSKEKMLLLIAFLYSGVISTLTWLSAHNPDEHYAQLSFQFFCPKRSGAADWMISVIRFFTLGISYSLSIIAYRELDFKRFIFVIFIFSNVPIIMRCIFVFTGIDKTTYHQFYYQAIILNFCGTLILYPYTSVTRYVRQPPSTAVLESFDAFLNCSPGITIIKCFALHLDQLQRTRKHSECFDSFIKVRACKMEVTLYPNKLIEMLPQLEQILEMQDVAIEITGSQVLLQKVKKGECTLSELKRIQKYLMDYCQKQLYDQWKKTESRVYIEQQFKQNVVIDEKMNSLGINLGY